MSTQEAVKDIVKATFSNLSKVNILPTPNEYAKEFYKVAKEQKHKMREFDVLDTIVQLIHNSILPTLSKNESEALVDLVLDLKNNPEKIFDKNIQDKVRMFAKNKTDFDTKDIELKAKKMAIFVNSIESLIGNVVGINDNNVDNINLIIDDVNKIDDIADLDLKDFQSQFSNISESLKESLSSANSKLEKGQESVNSLKNEITTLRQELEDAKKENELDHLTGIATRKTFDKQLVLFEKNYLNSEIKYGAIFLDIDFFKKVNDGYGHDAGDFILSTFAKVIASVTRDKDVLARYGGEEFVVLLTYEAEEELDIYVKRIKDIIKKYSFKYQKESINISFSGGVCFRNEAKDEKDCIIIADKNLYTAKNSGRDKICFYNREV